MEKFIIPVAPRTKKNSQRIFYAGGRIVIAPSKAYKEYEREAGKHIPKLHIDYAVNVKAVFYMPTRRRVDLVNLQEALCDVLVYHGCLEDDNFKIVASMDGSYVDYDKNVPRTEVTIERLNNGKR